MQSIQFAAAIRSIREDFKFSALLRAIPELPLQQEREVSDKDRDTIGDIVHDILIAANAHRDTLHPMVLELLGLERLIDRRFLYSLLADLARTTQWSGVLGEHDRYIRWVDLYWQLSAFERMAEAFELLVVSSKLAVTEDQPEIVTLEISDPHDEGVALDRLSLIFASLNSLTNAVAQVVGESETPCTISFADSGSPLVVGLRGGHRTIKAVLDLFRDFANSIRFSEEEKFERKVNAVSGGLRLAKDIKTAEVEGTLEPEEASRLTSTLVTEMTALLDSGVIPTEDSTPEPQASDRQILERFHEPKRLMSGNSEANGKDVENEQQSS